MRQNRYCLSNTKISASFIGNEKWKTSVSAQKNLIGWASVVSQFLLSVLLGKNGLDQSLENYVRFSMLVKVNSLPSARFRAFLEKRTPEHTWLCAGISLVWYALQTWWKSQKTGQVFYPALEKKFFTWGGWFFVSDVISGGTFRPPWPT